MFNVEEETEFETEMRQLNRDIFNSFNVVVDRDGNRFLKRTVDVAVENTELLERLFHFVEIHKGMSTIFESSPRHRLVPLLHLTHVFLDERDMEKG